MVPFRSFPIFECLTPFRNFPIVKCVLVSEHHMQRLSEASISLNAFISEKTLWLSEAMYSYLNKHGGFQELLLYLNVLVSEQTWHLSEASLSLYALVSEQKLLWLSEASLSLTVLVSEQTWHLSEASLTLNVLVSEQLLGLSEASVSLNALISKQKRWLSETSFISECTHIFLNKHGGFQKLLLYFNVLVFEHTWRLSEVSLSSNKLIFEQTQRLSEAFIFLNVFISEKHSGFQKLRYLWMYSYMNTTQRVSKASISLNAFISEKHGGFQKLLYLWMYSYLNKHGGFKKLLYLWMYSYLHKHGGFQKLLLYLNVLVFEQTWRLSEASFIFECTLIWTIMAAFRSFFILVLVSEHICSMPGGFKNLQSLRLPQYLEQA